MLPDTFASDDCRCIELRDGTIVLAPDCAVHGNMTDGEHGEIYDPRKVIPPPTSTSAPSTCVHDPIVLGSMTIPIAPMAGTVEVSHFGVRAAVCRKCRCVYIPGWTS